MWESQQTSFCLSTTCQVWTAEPSQIAQENHKLLSVFACIVYTEMWPGSPVRSNEVRLLFKRCWCISHIQCFYSFLTFVLVVLFGGGRSRKNLETELNFSQVLMSKQKKTRAQIVAHWPKVSVWWWWWWWWRRWWRCWRWRWNPSDKFQSSQGRPVQTDFLLFLQRNALPHTTVYSILCTRPRVACIIFLPFSRQTFLKIFFGFSF